MILSIFSADRLGLATWLMVFAGAAMIFVSMGCLTRDVPRFGLALAWTVFALAGAVTATLVTFIAAQELEAEVVRRAKPSAIVFIYAESAKGGELATLWLAWKVCLAASLTNLALVVYLPARLVVLLRARQRRE
jgi:hypothetical protein